MGKRLYLVLFVLFLTGYLTIYLNSQSTCEKDGEWTSASDAQENELKHGQLTGTWENVNPNTRGLVMIKIEQKSGYLYVHPYGACHPTTCDWGEHCARVYGKNIDAISSKAFTVYIDFGFEETIITGIRKGNYLEVTCFSMFKDCSNRSHYFSTDTLVR